jgi:hypothetical protein
MLSHNSLNFSISTLTRLFVRLGAFLVVTMLMAAVFLGHSTVSSRTNKARTAEKKSPQVLAAGPTSLSPIVGRRAAPVFLTPPAPPTVATFASNCTDPKTLFNLQDTDLTVCAKVTDASSDWRIIWSNAKFTAVQNVAVGTGTSTFTLNQNSSLGDWRVIVYDPFGGTVQAVTSFTVIDAANPSADISVAKGTISSTTSSGQLVVFSLQVSNSGPSTATTVQLTDSVPANSLFKSFQQLSGPVFSCTNPDVDATGDTVCTIATLNRDETATFVATYTVGTASAGDVISNTASITSATADPNANNSATAEVPVVPTACQLSTPDNITVNADSGQAGAVVTYSTPTGTGDCGQTTTGEGGETIPPITCNPASGSFFDVGTTTVICTAQTGTAVSFLVTVNNPGGLSISLNGANTLTIECGQRFTDPGATAVDASGQSVPVTITNPQGFDPNAPTVGSYVVSYTATVDQNSVSTTRTINVTDSEAPSMTVNGANPYRIITGSCLPFVDPGATAFDGCAGPEPVTSSISGPGGATSVNNSVPGTYTVTYTATDGTHQATATRTVLVGNFTQDESDQPDTGNVPPTITLNGNDQVTIECGTPFTDPGATATVCGNSVQVTVSGSVDIHTPGNYTLTYSATANGFTTTATRNVTVTPDNTAPVIQVLGANPMTVECHTSFTDPGATAHDACAGDFAATASGSVNVNVVGTYVISYNATDPSGFAATPVTRTVNVVDTTAPAVTAPAAVTVYTGSGASSCAVVVSDATLGTASATDSCYGSLSVTRTGVPAGNSFPVGQTTITYSATDPSNNTGTATQTVTVIDNTPPVISCPASITLEPTCPSGAIATYTAPVGTDNCAGATTARTAGLASGSVFPIGTTTVTYTVTDAAGNTASCSFQVTVRTPQQTIQNMVAAVQALQPPLTGTQVQGLTSKLQAALDAINQGKTNVACNKLVDFISQVTAYINNGTLTSAQGTPLITSANHVRNTIGCTNNPCS